MKLKVIYGGLDNNTCEKDFDYCKVDNNLLTCNKLDDDNRMEFNINDDQKYRCSITNFDC